MTKRTFREEVANIVSHAMCKHTTTRPLLSSWYSLGSRILWCIRCGACRTDKVSNATELTRFSTDKDVEWEEGEWIKPTFNNPNAR